MKSKLPVEVATNRVVDGNAVVVVVVVAAVVVDVVGATVVVGNIISATRHNGNNNIITAYDTICRKYDPIFSERIILLATQYNTTVPSIHYHNMRSADILYRQ